VAKPAEPALTVANICRGSWGSTLLYLMEIFTYALLCCGASSYILFHYLIWGPCTSNLSKKYQSIELKVADFVMLIIIV
jgi:hypothetical protein